PGIGLSRFPGHPANNDRKVPHMATLAYWSHSIRVDVQSLYPLLPVFGSLASRIIYDLYSLLDNTTECAARPENPIRHSPPHCPARHHRRRYHSVELGFQPRKSVGISLNPGGQSLFCLGPVGIPQTATALS